MDVRCRSPSSACRDRARRPCSPPSAATQPKVATPPAGRPPTSGSSRCRTSGLMPWPRCSTRANRSMPTSPTSTWPSPPGPPGGNGGSRPAGPDPELRCPAPRGARLRGPAAERAADPWRDVEELDLEYVVADLDVVTRRLERLRTSGRHGTWPSGSRTRARRSSSARLAPELEEGRPLRELDWTDDDERLARGFRFLSQKPQLVVLNVGEDRLAGPPLGKPRPGAHARTVTGRHRPRRSDRGRDRGAPEDEAQPFLDDLGIAEPSRTG